MKKIFSIIGVALLSAIGLAFALNSYVRVSNSENDWGIIEDWVFDGPVMAKILPPSSSSEYMKWKSAADLSEVAANLIEKYGVTLIANPTLNAERNSAKYSSEAAYDSAMAIPRAFLAESNAELPDMYTNYFVSAMKSWYQALETGDTKLLLEGNSKYNTFIIWMKSHKRSDFKNFK